MVTDGGGKGRQRNSIVQLYIEIYWGSWGQIHKEGRKEEGSTAITAMGRKDSVSRLSTVVLRSRGTLAKKRSLE